MAANAAHEHSNRSRLARRFPIGLFRVLIRRLRFPTTLFRFLIAKRFIKRSGL
jgi:hypothetical protein